MSFSTTGATTAQPFSQEAREKYKVEDEARKQALQLLAGTSPFIGTSSRQIRREIYAEVKEIIEEKWSILYQEPPWSDLLNEDPRMAALVGFFVGSVFKTLNERFR
jgi:hypothetical protein